MTETYENKLHKSKKKQQQQEKMNMLRKYECTSINNNINVIIKKEIKA